MNMNTRHVKELSDQVIAELARSAGIDVPGDRLKDLAALMRDFLAGAARLEQVDVADYEPLPAPRS